LLKDTITGKETLLIEGDHGRESDLAWYNPTIIEILDERYFVYEAWGYEWPRGCGVYDTQRMVNIPVEQMTNKDFAGLCNGVIYIKEYRYLEGLDVVQLYPVLLNNLDTIKALILGENLLEGIPEAEVKTFSDTQTISPNGRYLAANDWSGVRVFDLQAKSYFCRIPVDGIGVHENGQYFHTIFRDDYTLYCYEIKGQTGWPPDILEPLVLEITLP